MLTMMAASALAQGASAGLHQSLNVAKATPHASHAHAHAHVSHTPTHTSGHALKNWQMALAKLPQHHRFSDAAMNVMGDGLRKLSDGSLSHELTRLAQGNLCGAIGMGGGGAAA